MYLSALLAMDVGDSIESPAARWRVRLPPEVLSPSWNC